MALSSFFNVAPPDFTFFSISTVHITALVSFIYLLQLLAYSFIIQAQTPRNTRGWHDWCQFLVLRVFFFLVLSYTLHATLTSATSRALLSPSECGPANMFCPDTPLPEATFAVFLGCASLLATSVWPGTVDLAPLPAVIRRVAGATAALFAWRAWRSSFAIAILMVFSLIEVLCAFSSAIMVSGATRRTCQIVFGCLVYVPLFVILVLYVRTRDLYLSPQILHTHASPGLRERAYDRVRSLCMRLPSLAASQTRLTHELHTHLWGAGRRAWHAVAVAVAAQVWWALRMVKLVRAAPQWLFKRAK